MENNIKVIKYLSDIEKIYEESLSTKGIRDLKKLIWINIKDTFINLPTNSDLIFRVMIEELIIYGIAIESEKGYKKMKEGLYSQNIKLKIMPYSKMIISYKEYIKKIKQFLKKNPNRIPKYQ